jgi:hypothetical protein
VVGFAGRKTELSAIEQAFETVRAVLIEGLPGSGKSRLLEEAARRWTRGPVLGLDTFPANPDRSRVEKPEREIARPALVLADGIEEADGPSELRRLEAIHSRGAFILATSRTHLPEPAFPARRLLLQGLAPRDAALLLESALAALGTPCRPSPLAPANAPATWTPPGFEALGGHPACILSLASQLANGHRPEPASVIEPLVGVSLLPACRPLLQTLSAVTTPLPRRILDSLPGCDEQSLRTALHLGLVQAGPAGVAVAPPLRALFAAPDAGTLQCLAGALLLAAREDRGAAPAREALRLLMVAGAPDRLETLLVEEGPALLAAGHVSELELALDSLCRQAASRPELHLLRAELLVQTGRHQQARALLEPLLGASRTPAGLRLRASLALALVQLATGELEAGLTRLDELAAGRGHLALKALKLRADAHYRKRAFGPAESDYRACLDRVALPDRTAEQEADLAALRCGALAGLANLHRQTGKLQTSREFADRRTAELDETASPGALAAALTTRSTVEFLRGNLDEAAALTREAIRLRVAGGHPGGCAVALANLVQLEALRGDTAAAQDANARLEALDSEATSASRAAAAKGLATLHLTEGRPLEGLTAARQARELASDWRDGAEEAECLAVLAAALLACGDTQAARAAAEQGLGLARRMESAVATADNLLVLSELDRSLGDPESALGRAQEAASVATVAGYALGRATALLARGEAHLAAERPGEAVTDLEEALGALASIGAGPLQTRATECLASALLALGEWSRLLRLAATSRLSPALAALQARAAAALNCPETETAGRKAPWASPGVTLAAVWRRLRQGKPAEARSQLGLLPATGLTRAERVEEALLLGAALFGEGRVAEARVPLGEASESKCLCPARTAARAALELVRHAAGETPRVESPRAAAGELEPIRRWLAALGFGCALESTRYVLVDGDGPSFVREGSRGSARLEEMDLAVDLEAQRVFLRGSGWLDLQGKARPLALLALLARESGRLLSKQRIYEAVWGRRYNAELNAVNVHQSIHRLRSLLQQSGSSFDWVRTDQTSGCYGLAPDLKCGLWMRPVSQAS